MEGGRKGVGGVAWGSVGSVWLLHCNKRAGRQSSRTPSTRKHPASKFLPVCRGEKTAKKKTNRLIPFLPFPPFFIPCTPHLPVSSPRVSVAQDLCRDLQGTASSGGARVCDAKLRRIYESRRRKNDSFERASGRSRNGRSNGERERALLSLSLSLSFPPLSACVSLPSLHLACSCLLLCTFSLLLPATVAHVSQALCSL